MHFHVQDLYQNPFSSQLQLFSILYMPMFSFKIRLETKQSYCLYFSCISLIYIYIYIYIYKWNVMTVWHQPEFSWFIDLINHFYFPLLRPWADSNPYPAPAYWIADQRPNQLSHSRAQKIGWAEEFLFHSFMVQVCLNSRIIQLNYSTGSLLSNVSEM